VNEPVRPAQYRNIIGDTAANYAKLGYEEALKMNYVHGIAESLCYKAEIETFYLNFPVQERLSREAIDWYRKTLNKKGSRKPIIISAMHCTQKVSLQKQLKI
jgi:hypothetical protein